MKSFSRNGLGAWSWTLALTWLAGCGVQTNEPPAKEVPAAKTQNLKTASGMEMVLIPAGRFLMGADDGPIDVKPAHPVNVDAFLMDRSEITQAVFERIMGKNPSRRKHPQNPVEQVTWADAIKFCNARSSQEGLKPCYDVQTHECDFSASGYRLPTEAEWEYACRAGTTNRFYFGDQSDALKSHAWFEGNSDAKEHPVAHWQPNGWGLYDMTGNVWEWCNDFYGAKYYRQSPPENPRGPSEGEKRVLRGGAWSSKAEDCSVWARNCDEAGFTDVCLTMDSNGFRCVRRVLP